MVELTRARKRFAAAVVCLVVVFAGRPAPCAESSGIVEIKTLIETRRFDEAREKVRGLRVKRGETGSLELLGQVWIKFGRNDEAIETYKKILEVDTKNVNALFWLGTLYRWKGDTDASLAAYSGALEHDRTNIGSLIGRARIWLAKKEDARAEADLLRVRRLSPKNQEVSELLGRVYAARGDEARAIAELRNLHQGGDLHKAVGGIYRANGQNLKAIEEYRSALQTGPDDPEVHRSLAEIYRQEADLDSAIGHYKRVAELLPSDVDARVWLGTLYYWKSNAEASLEAYSAALEHDPQNLTALVGRARLWRGKKRDLQAEKDLLRARAIVPNDPETKKLLANIYFDRKEDNRAIGELKGVYSNAQLHKVLGDVYRGRDQRNRACREYQVALELAPEDPAVHRALGDLNREEGYLSRATDHWRKVVELVPDDPDAHFWVGFLYRQRGMLTEAEAEFRAALRVGGDRADSLMDLSRVLNSKGRTEEAEGLARKALTLAPKWNEPRVVLGKALESKGSLDEALQSFEEAFEVNPGDEEAWRGAWRTAPVARPYVENTFSYYDSKALEGRELPSPFPIQTEYSGYRLREEGRAPVSSAFSLRASAEQFNDKLDQRSAGFTIYDVSGHSVLVGAEYEISPRWKVSALGGNAWFNSNTEKPVNDDQITLTRDEITYSNRGARLLGRAGFERSSLLARSLAGDFAFRIFSENRLFSHLEKSWGDNWESRGDFAYTYYSDHTETLYGVGALDFLRDGRSVTIYGRYYPLQSRFLKEGDRLDFVNVASGGGLYRSHPLPPLELQGEYFYQNYSDDNDEHSGRASLAYTIPKIPPLAVGVEYVIDDFRRRSGKYTSLDKDAIGPFLRLKQTIVPRLDYDIRYAHLFQSDEATSSYGVDEVSWYFEYSLNFSLKAGAGGDFTTNALPETSQKYRVYLKYVF